MKLRDVEKPLAELLARAPKATSNHLRGKLLGNWIDERLRAAQIKSEDQDQ